MNNGRKIASFPSTLACLLAATALPQQAAAQNEHLAPHAFGIGTDPAEQVGRKITVERLERPFRWPLDANQEAENFPVVDPRTSLPLEYFNKRLIIWKNNKNNALNNIVKNSVEIQETRRPQQILDQYISSIFATQLGAERIAGFQRFDDRAIIIGGADAGNLVALTRMPDVRQRLTENLSKGVLGTPACSSAADDITPFGAKVVHNIRAIPTAIVENYASSCLHSLFSSTNTTSLDTVFKSRAAVLVTTIRSRRLFCSAFLVNPTQVVTARHCLFENGANYEGPLFISQVRVIPIGTSATEVREIEITPRPEYSATTAYGAAFTKPPKPYHIKDDFVILQLAEPVAGLAGQVTMGPTSLEEGEPITMLGFHWLRWTKGSPLAAALGSLADTLPILRDAYVKESGGICAAVALSSGCIVHGCQSLGQTSGAALFKTPANGPAQLIGTHWGGQFLVGKDEFKGSCFPNHIADKTKLSHNLAARTP